MIKCNHSNFLYAFIDVLYCIKEIVLVYFTMFYDLFYGQSGHF